MIYTQSLSFRHVVVVIRHLGDSIGEDRYVLYVYDICAPCISSCIRAVDCLRHYHESWRCGVLLVGCTDKRSSLLHCAVALACK